MANGMIAPIVLQVQQWLYNISLCYPTLKRGAAQVTQGWVLMKYRELFMFLYLYSLLEQISEQGFAFDTYLHSTSCVPLGLCSSEVSACRTGKQTVGVFCLLNIFLRGKKLWLNSHWHFQTK